MQTKQIIETAITNDPTATPEQVRRVLDALREKPANTKPKLITRKQAAAILDCCVMTIKRLEKRGHLTPIKFSERRVRLNESQVWDFARNGVREVAA